MLPKLNRKRAQFVLTKIDEILAWERRKELERDTYLAKQEAAGVVPAECEGGTPCLLVCEATHRCPRPYRQPLTPE